MASKEGAIGSPNLKDIHTPDLWRWRFGQIFVGCDINTVPDFYTNRGGLEVEHEATRRQNFREMLEHSRNLTMWETVIKSLGLNKGQGRVAAIFNPMIIDVVADRLRAEAFAPVKGSRKGVLTVSINGVGEEKMAKVIIPRFIGMGFSQVFQSEASVALPGYVFARQAKIR